MLGVTVRLVLSKEGMNVLELYQHLGGVKGSYEDAVTEACEELDLDPHDSRHRELVSSSVEDEWNHAFYMSEEGGGECPEGIEIAQPNSECEDSVILYVDGTDNGVSLPCGIDQLVPELNEETQARVDRLREAHPDVTFRWSLGESSY